MNGNPEPDYYYSKQPDYRYQPYENVIPSSEEINWKLQYSKVDTSKGFTYLTKKLKRLDIPEEKIADLIFELDIIFNNAGKMKIKPFEISYFLDEFNTFWENFCIYGLKNSRWVDELNHVRSFAEQVLLQEYHKSIEGWQGDNLLRHKAETSSTYNLTQRTDSPLEKRGLLRRKPKQVGQPVQQPMQTNMPQGRF